MRRRSALRRPTAFASGLQNVLDADEPAFFHRLREVVDYLASSRPTAVNLFWALERMEAKAEELRGRPSREIAESLLSEARAIHEEDRQMCRAIGRHGAELLRDGQGVLTHCNAGGLATADYGTALAVFFAAAESGKTLHVFADETRPLLQGARLTAWELQQRGIDVTLICDSMAAQVMREGKVQAVVTGADRIAANGDTANKIGTYGVAVLAKAHGIPFYIAAPSSTFDLSIADGAEIPIEAARPPRNHPRFRPPNRPRRRPSLQPGVRRHARRTDRRHYLRKRRDSAGESREISANANLVWCLKQFVI